MSTRPKRSAAAEDSASSSKRKRTEAKSATLHELIGKVLRKQGTWDAVYDRIKSHPDEVLPRNLYDALMIYDPIIPKKVISAFVQAKNVMRFETFHFMVTCPWIPVRVIEDFLDAETQVIFSSQEGEFDVSNMSAEANQRLHSLQTRSVIVMDALSEPDNLTPPRIEAVDAILLRFGSVILRMKDAEDGDVLMHNALQDERNAPYVRLIAEHGRAIDEVEDEDEDSDEPSPPFYGGLLTPNKYGSKPILWLARNWSDSKAAAMFDELLDVLKVPNDAIAASGILQMAINNRKWALSKRICHRVPESLKHVSVGNTPLHAMFGLASGDIDMSLCHLMIEQGLRVASEDQKHLCGGLLQRNWQGKSPMKILFVANSTIAIKFCIDLIGYLAIGRKSTDDDNDLYLVRIIQEAIAIKGWEIVQHFINTYPALLSIKDNEKSLILHHICRSAHTPLDLVQLAIEEGVRQEIGGKRGRGGLAIVNNNKETPLQLLGNRNCGSNNKLFKFLIEAKPKLILKKDYKSLKLLHAVADGGNSSVARQILKACPESISFVDENGRLPLHIACKRNSSQAPLLRFLLKEGVKHQIDGMGGLLVADNDGNTSLHYLAADIHYDERRWTSNFGVLFEGIVKEVPLLQAVINAGVSKYTLFRIVSKYKHALAFKDADGRRPLHTFMAKDNVDHAQFKDLLFKLIRAGNPTAVGEVDGLTGLYPFMTAASRANFKVSDVYDLLRHDPSMIAPSNR